MSDDDLSGLPPAQPEESGSLEDHEAAFGPGGTGDVPEPRAEASAAPTDTAPAAEKSTERDDQGRFVKTPRHRAKSQQAHPEDVPRIRELTAKLRQTELERDEIKARLSQEPTARPTAGSPPPPTAAPTAPPQPRLEAPPPAWTPPPTRQKPSEDEIGEKYKTYAEFTEDLADWIGEQRDAKREARQAQEAQQTRQREWTTQYTAQLAEAKTRYPDFDQQIQATDATMHQQGMVVPQVLLDAVLSSARGADLSYYLATHHDHYRELIRDAWAVNHPNSIAMVRRVLESALPPVASSQRPNGSSAAVPTGSAPRSPQLVAAPRPPNPVRTGPQKIGDEPPDDDDSLDAHEQYFHRRR